MKSHEVLRKAFKKVQPKNVARELKLSLSLIHQWSRPRDGKSDAMNPLDRTDELIRLTDDLSLLHWLCERHGGYFVPNPKVKGSARAEFLLETGSVMQEMAHLQAAVAEALLDGRVTKKEAVEVRSLWEKLKSDMERYSTECDKGEFKQMPNGIGRAGSPGKPRRDAEIAPYQRSQTAATNGARA